MHYVRTMARRAKAISSSHDEALRAAAEMGDLAGVKRALEQGAQIGGADKTTGYTALHLAARDGHASVVKLLLARGAPIEAALAAAKSTPLALAVQDRRRRIVSLLLDAGANPNVLHGRLRTSPLHDAADAEDEKLVALLLAAGANPNLKNGDGATVLQQFIWLAGERKKARAIAMVRALLAGGADPKPALKRGVMGLDPNDVMSALRPLLEGAQAR